MENDEQIIILLKEILAELKTLNQKLDYANSCLEQTANR
jgi:hypothetical protein